MAAHTQGPWRRDKYGHIVDADGRSVMFRSISICCAGHRDEVEQAERNTDLAAAAPALLAATQDALHELTAPHRNETSRQHAADALRAVILKATGSAA